MLLHLSVENFILIPQLEISLHKGFTCITGETGAGKSILVGALSLILGQRADTSVLRDKNQKCIVEGSFLIDGYNLNSIFEANDLDYEPTSVFRREINPQGKSRAFINDTPVNLNILKEIGDRLVDIHSQHQTLELNNAAFQLGMVDSYAGDAKTLMAYGNLFSEYNLVKTELDDCIKKEQQSVNEKEFLNFQFEELEKANLLINEQQEAEEELEILTHAEEIKTRTFSALGILADNDLNVSDKLSEIKQLLEQASRFSHHIIPLAERINGSLIEIKDIANELRTFSEQVHFDAERIEKIGLRLDFIYHLEQKHRVQTVTELMEIMNVLSEKLYAIGSLETRIVELKEALARLENELLAVAAVISKQRQTVIPNIEIEMHKVLDSLGMPSAKFKIKQDPLTYFSATGTDKITFLFSANKGGEVREIQKVASGGELSRLMLAMKSLIFNRSLLPTILFDEIDSGVSGDIAGKVGTIMRNMSANMQVIAITHLPQIAGKADSHLLAYKEDGDISTVSSLRILSNEDRVNEIARMLSDETITESAKVTARELLNYRN
ncbi:MAG: DNA repair protein RecN [Lentimicrobiaceae bacterium]|jgi:DNA repair protein RecN (Recombination protein N)